ATASLAQIDGVEILLGEVCSLVIEDHQIRGVLLADGSQVACNSAVIAAGTFLNGLIHVGDSVRPAGRWGNDQAANL
ncbi:FAD-dependent oxidoreductase, partial [Klebsiella pneumoniae]|uniref:FAD-dependent oxidoreductase n=1 Tax=Klebsiella pneumoniae TaxID=573 RepID=UPI0027304F08